MKPEMQLLFDRLKEGMLAFIEDDNDAPYSKVEVDTCMDILTKYLMDIDKTANKDEAMKIVEGTVLALNALNKKCDFSLIETDQREDICDIIIQAGHEKGYNELSEDITEEWREW